MFIPRHPVVENQFCSYAAQTALATGVGGVVAYAGSVVKLVPSAANQESVVVKMSHGDGLVTTDPVLEVSFGLLMQKVKTGYHQVHPTGFVIPGDLGSSDVIAQPNYDSNGDIIGTKEAPVGVAHLGIWDTVHYTCKLTNSVVDSGGNMNPGDFLYPAADEAKLTNNTADSTGNATNDKAEGARVANVNSPVAMVVKGASEAKCQANFNNTTLYPIRVKLFI